MGTVTEDSEVDSLAWLPGHTSHFRSLSGREGDDFHFYKYLQGEVPEGSSLGKVVKRKSWELPVHR